MLSYTLPIDPALLSSFLAVVELKTVSAAARALHLSQPAVTAQIRKLEEDLKTTLFLRSARGMEVTEQGKRFHGYARRIQNLVEEAIRDTLKGKEPSGNLIIGASTTIASYVLPSLLASYAKRYQNVSVNVVVGNTDEILKLVRDGDIPFGLVEGLSKAAQLRLEPFADDEIIAAAKPALAQKIRKLSDLTSVPIIWRESGSGTRAVVERALIRAGLPKRSLSYRFEMGGTEAIKGFVMAGMGIGFFSNCSIREEVARGSLLPIPLRELRVKRRFHWTLTGGTLTGPAASFFEFANLHRTEPVQSI